MRCVTKSERGLTAKHRGRRWGLGSCGQLVTALLCFPTSFTCFVGAREVWVGFSEVSPGPGVSAAICLMRMGLHSVKRSAGHQGFWNQSLKSTALFSCISNTLFWKRCRCAYPSTLREAMSSEATPRVQQRAAEAHHQAPHAGSVRSTGPFFIPHRWHPPIVSSP